MSARRGPNLGSNTAASAKSHMQWPIYGIQSEVKCSFGLEIHFGAHFVVSLIGFFKRASLLSLYLLQCAVLFAAHLIA